MKLTSVKYLVGNGFKNIWLNKLMSAASIGVLVACMSIIGLAVTISLNVDAALSDLEKENVIMVYFNDRNSAVFGTGAANNNTAVIDKNRIAAILPPDKDFGKMGYYKFVIIDMKNDKIIQECKIN